MLIYILIAWSTYIPASLLFIMAGWGHYCMWSWFFTTTYNWVPNNTGHFISSSYSQVWRGPRYFWYRWRFRWTHFVCKQCCTTVAHAHVARTLIHIEHFTHTLPHCIVWVTVMKQYPEYHIVANWTLMYSFTNYRDLSVTPQPATVSAMFISCFAQISSVP